MSESMALKIINTCVPFLMAPVKSMAILKDARVERSLFQSLLERIEIDAVSIFCFKVLEHNTDAHGCLLDSVAGSEKPFTGSAAGCLGAYMVHHGLYPGPVL